MTAPARRSAAMLISALVALSAFDASARAAPHRSNDPVIRRASEAAGPRLVRFLLVSQGRLLLTVRRPARVSVYARRRRLRSFQAKSDRTYEIPIHGLRTVRVVAVAGRRRQTVVVHVRGP
jgi:hypothetical protein